ARLRLRAARPGAGRRGGRRQTAAHRLAGARRAGEAQLVGRGVRRLRLGVQRLARVQHRRRSRRALVLAARAAADRSRASAGRAGPQRPAAHQPRAGSVKRALIVLLGALVLALGLGAGTVVFLAATEGGTRLLAAQAERFVPVRFTGVAGAL